MMKLLLILLIFGGLQRRVLVRYAEVFNPKRGHEIYPQKGTSVQAEIVHCKLQCFTEQFHSMALPGIPDPLIIILFSISIAIIFFLFGKRPAYADTQRFTRGKCGSNDLSLISRNGKAIQQKDGKAFNTGSALMTNMCNNCHRATKYEFM